jgi:hypothetical protein
MAIFNRTPTEKLSTKIRILIGIIALPSLVLASMLISMTLNGRQGETSYFEWVYALVGVFAVYIALTGKKFF